MSFTVRAVTLDLDDTLWPFAPIGARIEQAIHDWMRVHSPRTAEMFSIPAMRALRERTFADNPQLAHDLSALRRLTLAHALRESGADPSLLEPAFEAFYAARSEVECYSDSLAALQRIAARMPEIHVFRGSKSSGPFTDGRCHAGRRTLEWAPCLGRKEGLRMSDHMPDDVSAAGRDLRAYTDELRPRHGVVRNVHGEWVLLRHELVVRAALSDDRFSSVVSSHLHVPNGMDSAEHTAYRQALDRFLTREALAPFREDFRRVAADLIASLPRGAAVDAVSQVGVRFAVRAQSAWLGWPADLEDRLVEWVAENHAATRSGDKSWTRRVAESFDDLIRSVLEPRRGAAREDDTDDVTARLMRTEVNGRPLTDAEIVSVLRNWTGGDLGSIAQCIGVLVHYLATHSAAQDRLRSGVPDAEFDATIDEILRIDDPFVSNRRVTTCPVTIGGVELPQGARVKLNWTSANRDEAAFGDPDAMDPERNADRNLVYGIGRHACPGRLLATLEMRVAIQELLAATSSIALEPRQPAERAVSPVGGWAKVPVVLA